MDVSTAPFIHHQMPTNAFTNPSYINPPAHHLLKVQLTFLSHCRIILLRTCSLTCIKTCSWCSTCEPLIFSTWLKTMNDELEESWGIFILRGNECLYQMSWQLIEQFVRYLTKTDCTAVRRSSKRHYNSSLRKHQCLYWNCKPPSWAVRPKIYLKHLNITLK